jgi:transcriptional regulator with XRE-family HTH domain
LRKSKKNEKNLQQTQKYILTFESYTAIVIIGKCENAHCNQGGERMGYKKLRGKIREKFCVHEAFSEAMGMSPTTLSSKLNGKTEWTRQEIVKACELLDIPLAKAFEYFSPEN